MGLRPGFRPPAARFGDPGPLASRADLTMDTTLEQTHYATLGVPVDADATAIKVAYRRLAMDLHPDLHPDDVDAADRFALVTAAHTVLAGLADPDARKLYDLALAAPPVEPEPEPEEPWGEQVEVEVPAAAQVRDRTRHPHRTQTTTRPWSFKANRGKVTWAAALTVVPLALAFLAPSFLGTNPVGFFASLGVALLSAHRALFITGKSTRVLVMAILLAVAMPTVVALTSGTDPWPLAVALLTGVPLVVAGELIRSTRSDR